MRPPNTRESLWERSQKEFTAFPARSVGGLVIWELIFGGAAGLVSGGGAPTRIAGGLVGALLGIALLLPAFLLFGLKKQRDEGRAYLDWLRTPLDVALAATSRSLGFRSAPSDTGASGMFTLTGLRVVSREQEAVALNMTLVVRCHAHGIERELSHWTAADAETTVVIDGEQFTVLPTELTLTDSAPQRVGLARFLIWGDVDDCFLGRGFWDASLRIEDLRTGRRTSKFLLPAEVDRLRTLDRSRPDSPRI